MIREGDMTPLTNSGKGRSFHREKRNIGVLEAGQAPLLSRHLLAPLIAEGACDTEGMIIEVSLGIRTAKAQKAAATAGAIETHLPQSEGQSIGTTTNRGAHLSPAVAALLRRAFQKKVTADLHSAT